MFQDTKGATRRKRTNNDLQNITQKTKDRATRAPLKTRLNCPFPLHCLSFFDWRLLKGVDFRKVERNKTYTYHDD